MKRLHCTQSGPMAHHYKNILASHGIDCIIRNEQLASIIGKIPPNEAWPELWVADEIYEEASRVMRRTLLFGRPVSKPWICDGCTEKIEGHFTHCWKCGSGRSAAIC